MNLFNLNLLILEEKFKISLNKVELGITPEEYRDTDIDFFIGTSGGGYEILQQYFYLINVQTIEIHANIEELINQN